MNTVYRNRHDTRDTFETDNIVNYFSVIKITVEKIESQTRFFLDQILLENVNFRTLYEVYREKRKGNRKVKIEKVNHEIRLT